MMTSPAKTPLRLDVGEISLSGIFAEPSGASSALIVALHGGTLTSRIFDDPIPGEVSFVEIGAALGYRVLALDRPGYGTSKNTSREHCTFLGQITVLRAALAEAWRLYGTSSAGIVLIGHSFGGLIALGVAASDPDVPLLGVSTHGTGLAWQPGALEKYRARLSEAPFVEPTFNPHSPSYGPAWSWSRAAETTLRQCQAPMPMEELREVLRFPEHLREIAPHVKVPVQLTIAEYDSVWETAPDALSELSRIFPLAPSIEVRRQRLVGHQLNASFAARAFYLREFAFAEECLVRKRTADIEPI